MCCGVFLRFICLFVGRFVGIFCMCGVFFWFVFSFVAIVVCVYYYVCVWGGG